MNLSELSQMYPGGLMALLQKWEDSKKQNKELGKRATAPDSAHPGSSAGGSSEE
jgi:hypothetical protein